MKKKTVYRINEGKTVTEVIVVYGTYRLGNTLSVSLFSRPTDNTGKAFCQLYRIITVNFPESAQLPENAQFVDNNNNLNIEFWLEKTGLAKPLGIYHQSGYCLYPAYLFLTDED